MHDYCRTGFVSFLFCFIMSKEEVCFEYINSNITHFSEHFSSECCILRFFWKCELSSLQLRQSVWKVFFLRVDVHLVHLCLWSCNNALGNILTLKRKHTHSHTFTRLLRCFSGVISPSFSAFSRPLLFLENWAILNKCLLISDWSIHISSPFYHDAS